MATLITMSGLAGAGKDRTAYFLAKEFKDKGYRTGTFSIADTPKLELANLLSRSVEDMFGTDLEKNKNRPMLIQYAEMMKTFCGKDIWAKRLLAKINPMVELDFIFITDLRFHEEMSVFDEFNGDVIYNYVTRERVLPSDPEWLTQGYHKGLLEEFQLYQYYNIDPKKNPLAYEGREVFNTTFDSNDGYDSNQKLINQIKLFVNKHTKNEQSVSRISRSV